MLRLGLFDRPWTPHKSPLLSETEPDSSASFLPGSLLRSSRSEHLPAASALLPALLNIPHVGRDIAKSPNGPQDGVISLGSCPFVRPFRRICFHLVIKYSRESLIEIALFEFIFPPRIPSRCDRDRLDFTSDYSLLNGDCDLEDIYPLVYGLNLVKFFLF